MNKALGYLGLAARAGKIAVGAEDCGKALRRRRDGLVIAASDASDHTVEQIRSVCAGRGIALYKTIYTKQQLGQAVGRAAPVAVAYVFDDGLARALASAAESEREQEEQV